jgi:hypothetical protein
VYVKKVICLDWEHPDLTTGTQKVNKAFIDQQIGAFHNGYEFRITGFGDKYPVEVP